MNTLGSWIDQEAFAGLVKEIAPVEPVAAPAFWSGGGTAPVTRLMAEDFRQPDHFVPGPFPAAAEGMAASVPTSAMAAAASRERGRVRSFLESIRQKAEQSGLIPRGSPSASPGSAPMLAGGMATGAGAAQVPGASASEGNPEAGGGTLTGTAHPPSTPGWPPLPLPLASAQDAVTAAAPGAEAARWPADTGPDTRPVPPVGTPDWNTGTETAALAGAGDLPPLGPPPRRHVPHFEVPLGPLTTRLRALTDWIRRQIDAADIFIIDAQGCPVSDREASGDIVAGAVLLAEASRRAAPHLPSAAEGAIYLDLQDERRLCVIDTATRHGIFTLGLIVPDALAPRAADRLRRALRRTVEAEGQPLSLPPRERW